MEVEEELERVHLPMVCTCSPEQAEAAKEVMDAVLARLAGGSRSLRPRPVTPETFLSDVVLSLQADYQVVVVEIHSDQWFLAVAEQLLPDGRERRIDVQADAAEDGLAAIWAYLADEEGAEEGT